MGIRIATHILVGITDAKATDPRYRPVKGDLWEKDVKYWRHREYGSDKVWCQEQHDDEFSIKFNVVPDIIFNYTGQNQGCPPGVVGMIVHDGDYDSDIFRFLGCVDSKFTEPGYIVMPEYQPSDWARERMGYTTEDILCHRAVSPIFEGCPSISRMHWLRARYYLKQAGWSVKLRELRYILAWAWA